MATRRDETPCENYCEHSYEPDVVLSTVHLGCAATANIGDVSMYCTQYIRLICCNCQMTIISEFHYSIPTCIKPGFHLCLKGAWDMSKVPVTHVSTCVLSQAQ